MRKVRRHAGLGQREFAERVGVKAPTIGAWETSDSIEPPKGAVSAAKRIELAFNISAAWMLDIDAETPTGPNGPDGGEALPRLDSNQQPSGSRFALVTRGVAA